MVMAEARKKKAGQDKKLAELQVWQDREIRFDSTLKELKERRGERRIDEINSVEDTKGNNGERGSLVVTNLRILWIAHRNSLCNLSIGYNSVLHISIRKAKSRIKGTTQCLYIMTKFGQTRFEFIFTSLVKSSPRLFTTCQTVLAAYESSRLYRDLKLRGSIIKNGQPTLLPKENVYSSIPGVWNLSSDMGNLGHLVVTNVRVIWHADLAHNFNVSIPYMQIQSLRIRESRFGRAFVIEVCPKAGGYILGFRIDPAEKLEQVFNEVQAVHQFHLSEPIFGVEFEEEPNPVEQTKIPAPRIIDEVEILKHDEESPGYAAYFADMSKNRDRSVTFDAGLGLAVESIPNNMPVSQLWGVVGANIKVSSLEDDDDE